MKGKEMTRLIARVTEDGYLLGATDDFERGFSDRFWADYYGDVDIIADCVEIVVPEDMVADILAHGTSDQTYSDGYEAWQDILKRGRITVKDY